MYEPKGVDASMARNCLHIMMLSNNDWVVPASLDERRFAVFEIEQVRPRAWWDALHDEIDAGAARGYLKFLLERDLGAWHPRSHVPQTQALVCQKVASLDGFGLTWLGVLQEDVGLPVEVSGADRAPDWHTEPVLVSRKTMQALFKANEIPGPGSQRRLQTQLGMQLKKLVPDLQRVGTDRRYRIPPLPECRDHFEQLVGGKIDWEG